MNLVDLGAGLLNATARTSSLRIERDVGYGPHARHCLDIYHPRRPQMPETTLVFFYGGAWVKGSRQMYEFVGRAFGNRGFKTVIPDYRLLSHGGTGSALEDAALAMAWLAQQESEIVLLGHSAGAQLAGALAFSRQWTLARPIVRAFVGLAGPYRYIPPLRGRDMPPAFLLTAESDRLIAAGEAAAFAEALRQRGGRVEMRTYPRASHATLVGALSPLLRSVGPVLKDIEAFIASTPAEVH